MTQHAKYFVVRPFYGHAVSEAVPQRHEVGKIIEFSGQPGTALYPLNAPARAKMKFGGDSAGKDRKHKHADYLANLTGAQRSALAAAEEVES